MPIRIKKPQFKPYDKKYRRCALFCGICSAVFALALVFLFGRIMKTGSPLYSSVLMGAYLLYFVSSAVALITGVNAYRREDNVKDLGQCFFHFLALIFCALNLRFSLALIFAAFKLDNAAKTAAGTHNTYSEFIESQHTAWILIAAGMLCSFTLGIFAAVKLLKNREKK